jgi:hypothetical protein
VANSHVPYLQTLPKDEAIAFVSSLQKVKEHLSHELQWMNEQAHQKTMQLQGIDTLLAEAVGLGLVPLHAASTSEVVPPEVNPSSIAAALSNASQTASSATANGNNSVANPTELTDSTVSPSNAAQSVATAPPKRGKQRQQNKPPQAKRGATLPATSKTNTAKAKPGRPAQSSTEAGRSSSSGFQQFLQTGFQDQSMTDAVGEILAATKEPMNTDAIMAKLYDGLAGESYQRAKSSLSNILSVGKSKGKWKSTGRGLYVGS